jgi:predicted metallopeptidase
MLSPVTLQQVVHKLLYAFKKNSGGMRERENKSNSWNKYVILSDHQNVLPVI